MGGAAAASVPKALKEQLRAGGRMVIPVGTQSQVFLQIDKGQDGALVERHLMAVRYVPLVQLPASVVSESAPLPLPQPATATEQSAGTDTTKDTVARSVKEHLD